MSVIDGLEATSVSTNIIKNVLKGNNISLYSSSVATINVTAEYETIQIEASSSSSQTIKEKTIHLKTSASSGGIANSNKLLANEVVANVSSGGTIQVHPLVGLKAETSSGGHINFDSSPKTVQKSPIKSGCFFLYLV
ncbi:GIN domain-containing protein [Flavobacterium laiguense]|uniref:Putative auto-transporter adhesin head GIN domain-containing protein n=1 Tax=Flavobacterium laiguense TaxID=2169409 RepID=A0A2U1JNC3_9FLAO|nr:DUF2807 domain-containing protein [Flavobacterium laiguense]PWA06671.1 hypothetical protein DB891_15610 [Flavobacterium laiguense]